MSTPQSAHPEDTDRRAVSRGRDRRREAWRTFRHAYPAFLKTIAAVFLLLVVADLWLAGRRVAYGREIARLRAGMTGAERRRSDIVIQSEQDKLRMALELAKRQAQWDPKLHLSVAVDSGRMYLERDGALLRDMVVAMAPPQQPAAPGDTAMVVPRGQRTIAEVRGGATPELVLNGGARVYAPADSAAAAAPVTPGDVRASAADLKAILPNVHAGMTVYFY